MNAEDAEDMALLAGAALTLSEPRTGYGQLTVNVERDAWLSALLWARDEQGCASFDYLCGVDELDADPPRIAVVAHLYCPRERRHLLLRTLVPRDDLHLSTATGLLPSANRYEHEIALTFGVIFTGHPGIDPLLRPDGREDQLAGQT